MTQPHLRKTTATLLASASLTLSSRIQAQEYNPTAPRLASWPQDLAHPQGTNGWFYRVGTPGTGTGVGTWTDVWAEAIYNNAAAYRYPGPTGANVLDPAAKYALTNQKTTIFHYNTGVDGSVTAADCANGVWASFHFRRTNQAPGAGTSMEFKMVAHYAATSTSVAQSVLVWNEPINNGDLNWRSRTFSLPNFRKDTSLEISVGSASALVDYTNYDLEIDVQRRPTLVCRAINR